MGLVPAVYGQRVWCILDVDCSRVLGELNEVSSFYVASTQFIRA